MPPPAGAVNKTMSALIFHVERIRLRVWRERFDLWEFITGHSNTWSINLPPNNPATNPVTLGTDTSIPGPRRYHRVTASA